MSEQKLPIKEWFQELLKEGEKMGIGWFTKQTDQEAWEDFYNDDFSPREALQEEVSCWTE